MVSQSVIHSSPKTHEKSANQEEQPVEGEGMQSHPGFPNVTLQLLRVTAHCEIRVCSFC